MHCLMGAKKAITLVSQNNATDTAFMHSIWQPNNRNNNNEQ